MSKLWKKINILSESYPTFISDSEKCLYTRDYISGGGFEGEANQLILNFKKSLDKKGTAQWQHRDRAVRLFAQEIASIVPDVPMHFMAIPGSKPWEHSENNQRFQDLFKELKRIRPKILFHWPINCRKAIKGSSQGGTRSPKEIMDNYKWAGFSCNINEISKIIIVDDVITSGAHFRACVDYLKEQGFKGEITGVFWAKTRQKDPFEEFTD